MSPPGRRVGLIGLGRIGGDVARAWQDGELPGWTLVAALVARPRTPPDERIAGLRVEADPARFLAHRPDLIVECAGPAALAMHGAAALAVAEVWTTSAAALADPVVHDRLGDAARRHGRSLRLLAGAIAGLDGLRAIATDPAATLELTIDVPPGLAMAEGGAVDPDGIVIAEGSVREVARRFPDLVNVAVAAALAGPGLDRSRLRLIAPSTPRHRLAFQAAGRSGTLSVDVRPRLDPGWHPVAAAIIGALREAAAPIRLN